MSAVWMRHLAGLLEAAHLTAGFLKELSAKKSAGSRMKVCRELTAPCHEESFVRRFSEEK
jgi:hypothetical protein